MILKYPSETKKPPFENRPVFYLSVRKGAAACADFC